MSNLKRKILNKNILIALITTAILVVLILCTNSTALAFISGTQNQAGQNSNDVNYQFGYGEPPPTSPLPDGSTDIRGAATTDGRFIKDTYAYSIDQQASVHIPIGTVGLDKNLQPLTYLSIKPVSPAPDPPEGYLTIGNSYDFGPSGSTFDPPVTISFTFDPNTLPANVDVKTLKLAIYVVDPATGIGHWTTLTNIRIVGNKISGDTDHFTIFAIIAPLPVPPTTTTPAQTTTVAPTSTTTAAAPGPTSTTTPPTQAPTTTAAQTTTTAASVPEATNWTLIGTLIGVAAIVVVLLAVYFLRWRKSST
ncbi:MAG: hypothetical protein ACYDG5_04880 [Dehalococcoidales bacterium]